MSEFLKMYENQPINYDQAYFGGSSIPQYKQQTVNDNFGGNMADTSLTNAYFGGNMSDIMAGKTPGAGNTSWFDGLGNSFSSGLSTLGGYAKDGASILGLVSGLDNLFGSGKDMRKLSKSNLQQKIAQNAEAMQMMRDDRQDFKDQREKVTKSYFS